MSFFASFFKSFYVKAVFVILIGALGITAGVHIGYTYFLKEKKITFAGPQAPPISSLSFVAGDLFPWENYTDANGKTGNFEQLLIDKQSVILFTDLGCPTCLDLIAFWRKEVHKVIIPSVQEIACLPIKDKPIPAQYAALFDNFTVIFYDSSWAKKYKKVFSPIIIGVDQSGFVTYEQFGFEGYIEYPIVNRFCVGRK